MTALLLLSFGIVLQIKKTYQNKSVQDIALAEVILRFSACQIILAKFISLQNIHLIIGQIVFNTAYGIYLVLVLKYKIRDWKQKS